MPFSHLIYFIAGNEAACISYWINVCINTNRKNTPTTWYIIITHVIYVLGKLEKAGSWMKYSTDFPMASWF